MNTPIFDRELEAIKISKLLKDHFPTAICVSGPSGVGKSALVAKCVEEIPTLSFSFKEMIGVKSPLSSFILNTNRKYTGILLEKYTKLKLKDIRIGGLGLSTSMEILPSSLDQLFFEYFFERLHRAGFRCFRVENVELCKDDTDIAALQVLSEFSEPHLKLIFEVGSLSPLDRRLRRLATNTKYREVFLVHPFSQAKTIGFYRFIHEKEPPHDIYQQSCGLPLAVEHQAYVNQDDSNLEWIKERLDSVDHDSYSLAYALSNFDEPCPTVELDAIHDGNFANSLLQLIRKRVVREDVNGIRFSHPAFRYILRRDATSYLDKKFLTKAFAVRAAKKVRSIEDAISLVTMAARLDDNDLLRIHGFQAILECYKTQNALQLQYISEILLENTKLSKRQRRILLTIRIQALCQLNRTKEARQILEEGEEALAEDRRLVLLQAMVSTLNHEWANSNAFIASVLPHLDDRSLIIALAIKVSNDIPLEDAPSALTAFEDAYALASSARLEDLLEELSRLHARLSQTPELAIERMRDYLAEHPRHGSNEIARARLLHNLGVQESSVSGGLRGMDNLRQARSVFTRHGLNFSAYSAVSQSICEIAQGRAAEAIEMLIDAQCLCREQYDIFGVLNNLAICFLCTGQADKALAALNRAEAIVVNGSSIVDDKIMLHSLYLNKSVAHLLLEHYEDAQVAFDKVPRVNFARHEEARIARYERVAEAVSTKNAAFPIENNNFEQRTWAFSRYNISLFPLSFYDFPFSLLSFDEVGSLLSVEN